ncbi:hypothetical protein [Promicromonospora aerolata]|uniref:Uncharacterized protein n=1 Tax=Promicromonospora aerolata TaxID=195749 RepID=A0ABW4VEG1_9MICO
MANNPTYAVGQYVSCQHDTWPARRTGVVIDVVPPATAFGHDFTAYIVAYPPSADEHPAVQALAIYDGQHRGIFRAEELRPVSADDAPPTTGADAVGYVTGRRFYYCPVLGCDHIIGNHGDDDFAREVEAHRRTHHQMPAGAADRLLAAIRELDGEEPTGALTGEPGAHSEARHNDVEKTMNTNPLTDDDRAQLVAALPPGSDMPVAEALLERGDTLDEVVRRFTPAFPMPSDVPLPSWANGASAWEWSVLDRHWSRRVARDSGIMRVDVNAFQDMATDGGPVEVSTPVAGLDGIDEEEVKPDQLAAVGRFLIDAADALRAQD